MRINFFFLPERFIAQYRRAKSPPRFLEAKKASDPGAEFRGALLPGQVNREDGPKKLVQFWGGRCSRCRVVLMQNTNRLPLTCISPLPPPPRHSQNRSLSRWSMPAPAFLRRETQTPFHYPYQRWRIIYRQGRGTRIRDKPLSALIRYSRTVSPSSPSPSRGSNLKIGGFAGAPVNPS